MQLDLQKLLSKVHQFYIAEKVNLQYSILKWNEVCIDIYIYIYCISTLNTMFLSTYLCISLYHSAARSIALAGDVILNDG